LDALRKPRTPARPDNLPAAPAEAGRRPDYGRLQTLLREDILEGRIPAGSRIKVSDIAARYNTSTNPAREALQGLEGEGLVVITPNRGARVRQVDEDMVKNIFDIRDLFEPYFVRAFVELATGEEVAELRRIQERCQAAEDAGDYQTYHIANTALHDHIRDWHPNAEAIRILKRHSFWLRSLSRKNPLTIALMRQSNAEHWELVEAIEAGDPERAVAAIGRHTRRSREVFLANLRRARLREQAESA
jgi:DNA-binding GntR family transcriptional regulator